MTKLGPEDAGVIIQGNGSTVLSGGAAVPAACWTHHSTSAGGVSRYACDLSSAAAGATLRGRARRNFRSVTVDGVRGVPARFPDAGAAYGDATQFLYVDEAYEMDDEWYFTATFSAGAADSPDGAALPAWFVARCAHLLGLNPGKCSGYGCRQPASSVVCRLEHRLESESDVGVGRRSEQPCVSVCADV